MSENNTIAKMKSMFGPSALNDAVKENGGTISPIISNANDTTVVVEAPRKKRGRPPKRRQTNQLLRLRQLSMCLSAKHRNLTIIHMMKLIIS